MQPIIGCEVYVAPREPLRQELARAPTIPRPAATHHLILLAQNEQRLPQPLPAGHRRLPGGLLLQAAHRQGAAARAQRGADLPLGLPRERGQPGDRAQRPAARARGRARVRRRSSPAIATTSRSRTTTSPEQVAANRELRRDRARARHAADRDQRLPLPRSADDAEAHEVLLCIQTGKTLADPKRWSFGTDQLFVKSPEEMRAAFADFPEAIDNTVDLAAPLRLQDELRAVRVPGVRGRRATTRSRRRSSATRAPGSSAALAALAARDERGAERRAPPPYYERLEIELGVIPRMGFAGYFLIVSDFINWAKRAGHPGRARARLGGGQPGRLGAADHRHRSDRARPAVRALPQSGAQVDARHRHRLLLRAPRRGDPVRARASTARTASRRSSPSGRSRGRPRSRTSAASLDFTFGETDRLAKLYPGAAPGQGLPARRRRSRWSRELREMRERGEREGKLLRLRAQARGPDAPPLEARRRDRDRRAAAGRVVPLCVDKEGNVLTQFSGTDIEKIGLIKFDFLGLKNLTLIQNVVRRIREGSGDEARRLGAAARRREDLQAARARRDRRRLPAGVERHARAGDARSSRPASRTSSRSSRSTGRGRSTPAWSTTSSSASTAARRSATAPAARADPARDLRHHRLPGAGDAGGAGAGRLLARRRRHPAPRDGQEEGGGDGARARALRRGRGPRTASPTSSPATSST